MGYAEHLRELLRPLGVYDLRSGSFSGSELEALGAALDAICAHAEEMQEETLPLTAKAEGLEKFCSLFPRMAASTLQEKRDAVAGFLRISGDSFTGKSLSSCLAACGTACAVTETDDPFTVEVRFPDCAGEPKDFAAKKQVIESILPCHLQVNYVFSWAAWQDLAVTWDECRGMTFLDLAMPK